MAARPEPYPAVRAALLAEGGSGRSNPEIAAATGTTARIVQRVRAVLGVPTYARGRRQEHPTLMESVSARLVVREDGHTGWRGPRHGNYSTPLVYFAGITRSVAREIFVDHHGREPVGYVKAACGVLHCLTREHLADSEMRRERT